MHVVHPVCGGMDGHTAQWTACLRRVHDDVLLEGGDLSRAAPEPYALSCFPLRL